MFVYQVLFEPNVFFEYCLQHFQTVVIKVQCFYRQRINCVHLWQSGSWQVLRPINWKLQMVLCSCHLELVI